MSGKISHSATTALCIPEILEAVLIEVLRPPPMLITKAEADGDDRKKHLAERADILRFMLQAMRVNKTWHLTISTSKQIKETMFFAPAGPNSGYDPDLNPLLAHTFPWFFHGDGCNWEELDDTLTEKKTWNLLRSYERSAIRREQAGKHVSSETKREMKRRKDAVLRKNASWRRMVPCVPAMPIIKAKEFKSEPRVRRKGKLELGAATEPYLTMGLLYDICEEYTRAGGNSYFMLYWYAHVFDVDKKTLREAVKR
jgi:hypothetical protein